MLVVAKENVALELHSVTAHTENEITVNLINYNTGQIIQKKLDFSKLFNKLFKSEKKRLQRDGWDV